MSGKSKKPLNRKTRMKICERVADYKFSSKEAPITRVYGGLNYSTFQRYDVKMPNKDVFYVNAHGVVGRMLSHADRFDYATIPDTFVEEGGLDDYYRSIVDHRLRDLRDRFTKYMKKEKKGDDQRSTR